jgi:hypothetical protein
MRFSKSHISRIIYTVLSPSWEAASCAVTPTSGGCSVGIVRSRTQTMECSLVFSVCMSSLNSARYLLHAGFLLGVTFHYEDGGGMFL